MLHRPRDLRKGAVAERPEVHQRAKVSSLLACARDVMRMEATSEQVGEERRAWIDRLHANTRVPAKTFNPSCIEGRVQNNPDCLLLLS